MQYNLLDFLNDTVLAYEAALQLPASRIVVDRVLPGSLVVMLSIGYWPGAEELRLVSFNSTLEDDALPLLDQSYAHR